MTLVMGGFTQNNPGVQSPMLAGTYERKDWALQNFRDAERHPAVVANFVLCNLQNADFQGLDMHMSTFELCDLRGCDFRGCDLRNVTFRNCWLSEANFERADLRGAHFAMCNLGAYFTRADVSSTWFEENCVMRAHELLDAVGTNALSEGFPPKIIK